MGKHPALERYIDNSMIVKSWQQLQKHIDQAFSLQKKAPKKRTMEFEVLITGVMEQNIFSSIAFLSEDAIAQAARFFFHQPDLFTPNNYGLAVYVYADKEENREKVRAEIEKLDMKTTTFQDSWGFVQDIFAIMELVFTAFGLIAFGVALIGIVNTLFMSIYERKHEIGVWKALGATRKEIRLLFALEASILGIGGCILGVFAGTICALCANYIAIHYFSNFWGNLGPFEISIMFLPYLFFVTGLVSFIAGLYPAHRASSLDPVEALHQV